MRHPPKPTLFDLYSLHDFLPKASTATPNTPSYIRSLLQAPPRTPPATPSLLKRRKTVSNTPTAPTTPIGSTTPDLNSFSAPTTTPPSAEEALNYWLETGTLPGIDYIKYFLQEDTGTTAKIILPPTAIHINWYKFLTQQQIERWGHDHIRQNITK